MAIGTVVAGAAPVWVADRIRGQVHQGIVLHAGSDAIYFTSHDDVIGIVSSQATPIPCTISTRLATLDGEFSASGLPQPGDLVTIGAGFVTIADIQVRVARLSDYRMPKFAPNSIAITNARLRTVAGESLQSTELPAELINDFRVEPAESVHLLLGRGSGLTPFGDDVTCGMLATLLATGDACAMALRERVLDLAPDRTTSLSATLLRRAAEGDVLPVFADAVSSLAQEDENASERIQRLLSIGHTSGAGMLLGFSIALDHITLRSCS